MIIPIQGLKYQKFRPLKIDEEILLVKEKENLYENNAVAAYNFLGEQIGYISSKSAHNKKVYTKMLSKYFTGKVWAIGKNQILLELD